MAKLRKYKRDLSDAAKVAFMSDGMKTLRNNERMQGLIDRMFNDERGVAEKEREIFSQPIRMELTFNYINLSFQLFQTPSDEVFRTYAKYLPDVWRYYDKRLSLDIASEEIPIKPNIWTNKLKVLTKPRIWKQLKLVLILLLRHNYH